MNAVKENLYFASFRQLENAVASSGPSWAREIRQAAFDNFVELGFPTLRDEEWKYTNVSPIAHTEFQPGRAVPIDPRDALRRFPLFDLGCSRLAFVNGRYCPELSTPETLPAGVKAGSLAGALGAHPALLETHLAKHADFHRHAFVALNTAFLEDGAFIEVPKGLVLDRPLHLLFISKSEGRPTVSHPRNLILAGPNSQLRLIETYWGCDEEAYFTNAVTELVAGQGAIVDYTKVQQESDLALHYARVQVEQQRASSVTTHSIALGGSLVREEVQTVLNGEGAEGLLHGLYIITGRQHVDNHTTIDHAQPHCSSRELYKGVLEGKSQGVFNGKIIVRKDAQKTDSKQSNKNLLLSEEAVINTKPQLEIFADDVKCTHGATVGQIDADAIFYLRSRGIAHQEARSLLTYAFANDIMERITHEPLRERLKAGLFARLARPQRVEEA